MGKSVDTDDILRACDKFLKRCAVDFPNKYFERQSVRLVVEKLCEQAPNYRSLETMKNGKWLIKKVYNEQGKVIGYNLNCSNCGFFWREYLHAKVFKFCPHCGAKMVDGEVTE